MKASSFTPALPVSVPVLRLLAVASLGSLAALSAASAAKWNTRDGNAFDGEFLRLQGDQAVFRQADGGLREISLGLLDPASGETAGELWRKHLSDAVKRIDSVVESALRENKIQPNPAVTDEQFLRRVYLDLTGTIPTYEQTAAFLKESDPLKRSKLVSRLLESDGYVSHLYNYFADLIRIQDYVPGSYLRMDSFVDWLKDHLRQNTPFDKVVYQMLTAEGRIWEDPAVGFYLRDFDTKLDHVQYTAKILLGTDIACAQCHDDPFQDWTQMDYYRLTAFLGQVESKDDFNRPYAANAEKEIEQELIKRNNIDMSAEDAKYQLRRARQNYERKMRWMRDASKLVVYDTDKKLTLPDTYSYPDGKPGDVIMPVVPFGDDPDYVKGQSAPRQQYARWMASPENPRFAKNIANRMWARFFGRGVAEPLHNMNLEGMDIPALMKVLEEEMIAVGFDLKTFAQIVVNTKTYQRLASREFVSTADPYFFPGPVLRRMTAEQIWDSLMTLMVPDPMRFRKGDGKYYNETINLLNEEGPMTAKEYFARVAGYERYSAGLSNFLDTSGTEPGVEGTPVEPVMMETDMGASGGRNRPAPGVEGLSYGKLVLARASEIEQPAAPEHFLRKFGQSERNFVIGASTQGGSVPQVMEMMNGFATTMLTSPDSALFKKMNSTRDRMEKANIVFMSILNRKIDEYERSALIYTELDQSGEAGYSNLIWALLNTPEFFFIK